MTAKITRTNFRDLVRQHGPELRVYCQRMVGGREAVADEILQQSFQVAWARRETFQGGNLRSWLYAIVRRQALGTIRREVRYHALAPVGLHRLIDAAQEPLEDSRETRDRLRILHACFASLKALDATIVQVSYGLGNPDSAEALDRLTYAEIGQLLQKRYGERFQPDRVRMRLKRALLQLARCMTEAEATQETQGLDEEKPT